MTSKLSLGPILLGAGLAAAAAAVIAGFIVVGGPGNARNERLDAQTLDSLALIARGAECTFRSTGATPATLAQLLEDYAEAQRASDLPVCDPDWNYDEKSKTLLTDTNIEYQQLGDSQIRLCGVFRAPGNPNQQTRIPGLSTSHPELNENRPTAGRHCYDIDLAR